MTDFKVVVLGDKGVGKTCLVLRFIEGFFSPKQQSTIGAFFLTKKVTLSDGFTLKMQLWDTAGQERFRAMAPMYYRGAASAIVCFDITNEDSFAKMKDWVEELRQNCDPDSLVLVVACNKCDLEDERVVSTNQGHNLGKEFNCEYIETSAKLKINVNEIFFSLIRQINNKSSNQKHIENHQSGRKKKSSREMFKI